MATDKHSHTLLPVRVWDLPTRLFHWSLVVAVTGAFITVKLGGLWMDWHVRFGLTAFALLLFRLIWGLIGPRYARFTQFVKSPATVSAYLKNHYQHTLGHSPLGALSVMAMLLIFGFQAISGLFANDDILTSGPLAYLNSDLSSRLTELHKLNEWIMLGVISLHLLAILWHRTIRKQKLISAMVHGDSKVDAETYAQAPPARDTWQIRLGALLLASIIIGLTYWLTTLAPTMDFSF
jgi:cytochrome b